MKNLTLKRLMIAGLLGTSIVAIASTAKAQANPTCYVIKPSGEKVSLDPICGQSNSSVVSQNQNNTSPTPQAIQQSSAQNQPYPTNLPTSYPRAVFNIEEDNLNTLSGQQTVAVQNNLRNLANDGISPQLRLMSRSRSLRSEPGGGTLVEQVAEGEWLQVYPDTRVNGFVYVQTRSGASGWVRQ